MMSMLVAVLFVCKGDSKSILPMDSIKLNSIKAL